MHGCSIKNKNRSKDVVGGTLSETCNYRLPAQGTPHILARAFSIKILSLLFELYVIEHVLQEFFTRRDIRNMSLLLMNYYWSYKAAKIILLIL